MAFLENNFFYLILLLFTLSYPLLQSFERRIKYYTKWKSLFKGIFFMMCLFIPWDIIFTSKGIWGFNHKFILEIPPFLFLPLEEWLFFIIVPFACVFIYEVLNYFFPVSKKHDYINNFLFIKSVLLLVLSFIFHDKTYTAICFSLASFFNYFLYLLEPSTLFKIYRAYLVTFFPFVLINGFLTGSFSSEPVVWYNDLYNLGIRFLNIPIEDFVYNFLMLSMVLFFYVKSLKKV